MNWVPCSDCKTRLTQRKLDNSQPLHHEGLQVLEVVHETKDIHLRREWFRQTRLECVNCDLKWMRNEGNFGELKHYDSSLHPEPTSEQEPAMGL